MTAIDPRAFDVPLAIARLTAPQAPCRSCRWLSHCERGGKAGLARPQHEQGLL